MRPSLVPCALCGSGCSQTPLLEEVPICHRCGPCEGETLNPSRHLRRQNNAPKISSSIGPHSLYTASCCFVLSCLRVAIAPPMHISAENNAPILTNPVHGGRLNSPVVSGIAEVGK